MSALPAPLAAFADGPGDLAAARALAGAPEASLLALVAALTAARQRTHLEALGEAGLGKEVKKAARAAAYKLKSAGVAGEVRKASAIDLTAFVELERVAVVGPPALDGQAWILAATLPGAPGFEFDLKTDGETVRIEAAPELGRGRLRKFHEQAEAGRSLLAHADLAVRMIDRLGARLAAEPGGLPASFALASGWRDAAVAHGADPARFDARARLAAGGPVGPPAEETLAALLEDVRVGYLVPPEAIVRRLENALGGLMHGSEAVAEDAFRAAFERQLDDGANAWMSSAGGAVALAGWLEDDADVMLARGEEGAALALLGLSDAVRAHTGPGRELPLLARAVRAVIDYDAVWEHRQAHIAGHAHHDHD